jgi:molybdopterin/thiamine biosynthesis adenylyltransferase
MMLRIDEQRWQALAKLLLARTDVESAAIMLCQQRPSTTDALLTVRDFVVVPNEAYVVRRYDQLRLDPVAINRLTKPARTHGLSIITVHTHPMASEPWFSHADDVGDSRLMQAFHNQIPGRPHGSVVLVPTGNVAARYFDEDIEPHDLRVCTVGNTVLDLNTVDPDVDQDTRFVRQAMALGARGQAILRRCRVGVVGLGGTGSVVAVQLAHLGVGELVLVEGDQVESTNLSRVVGARRSDVDKMSKVHVMERYVVEASLPSRVAPIASHLVGEDQLAQLRGCDVVFSCVDRHTPRALLNRMAYEDCMPVIDLGTAFRVDKLGVMTGDAGRVVVVGPGKPCLACWGHISPDALRVEALSEAEREQQEAEGYVQGANVPQPSVVAFNTMVAGAAVVEFLRLLTAFAGGQSPPQRLAFSFSDGTVRRNGLRAAAGCRICDHVG